MKFADILAQSIHDIKNSLGMILNNIDVLLADAPECIHDHQAARLLQHEAKRANNNLVQLLSLYKLDVQRLSVHIAEHSLAEFCEEIVAEHQAMCKALGVRLDIACDDYLVGYFDLDLVRGVVGSILGNAQRYAKTTVRLSADQLDAYLVIRVEDDGAGYPAGVMDLAETEQLGVEHGFSSGRTHLGLYFARQVARLHTSGERQGRVSLRNGRDLPGGCFELWLP